VTREALERAAARRQEIRSRYLAGETAKALANEYGISPARVSQISGPRGERPPRKLSEHEKKLRRSYGLSLEGFRLLEASTGGRCSVCELDSEKLYIDRCRVTRDVHGLLCGKCSSGIRAFGGDFNRILNAAFYAERRAR